MNNWISTKTKQPDEHKRYLTYAFVVDCYIQVVCLWSKEHQSWILGKREVDVFYWMELPKGPGK